MKIAFLFAIMSFLAYAGQLGILLYLHIKKNSYSFIKHAVSDYGVGPTKNIFQIRAWLDGFGAISLAASFLLGLGLHSVLPLIIILAAVRICAGIFPTDLEGQKFTKTGLLHYIFAILSFGFAYMVIVKMNVFFSMQTSWQPVYGILLILVNIATPALVAVIVTMWKPLRNIFGLCERIFIVAIGLWFLVVSGFLVFISR